jgi:hypothetical protein
MCQANQGDDRMKTVVRWTVVAVVVMHGLLHLFGAAKGLGWAQVTIMKQPISAAMGATWLAASLWSSLACSWPSRLDGGGVWVLSPWSCHRG